MSKEIYPLVKYEYDLILAGLNSLLQEVLKNQCKWERQSNGHFYYTKNKAAKQICFVISHIEDLRELNEKKKFEVMG